MLLRLLFLTLIETLVVSGADLPTLYEYYTADGITSGLSVDQPYFTLNGKNFSIYSGAMHYFRIPPQYWRDRLQKLRAAGLNTVETYVAWNLHEPKNGTFDFETGFADLKEYLYLAQEQDLFVILRSGPYICGEWEWGGFPPWLLREEGMMVRTADSNFLGYVRRYFNALFSWVSELQFTKGGPVIMVQVENEYGFSSLEKDPDYLEQLRQIILDNEIVELLSTCDGAGSAVEGSLPSLFKTADFFSDVAGNLAIMEEIQPGKPLMAMEFYPGWLDHWTEVHHTTDAETFREYYEQVLTYPASVNIYMFHGGTNWGFFNGANIGPGDNSEFEPTTTSYDYDAPLTEAGDYTPKYDIIRELIAQYSTIEVLTPDPPELSEREVYPTTPVESRLSFSEIIRQAPHLVLSQETIPMELLPINDNSGQGYGYIVYRRENIDIPANAVLTITGHVRDTVMVLINGEPISPALLNSISLNGFGFWRMENSSITLTTEDLTGATLDLVFENWGRANFGYIFYQFKGLTQDNKVYLDDVELTSWIIYPLEFLNSWISELENWAPIEVALGTGPALYRATFTRDYYPVEFYYNDTFINMREWTKGFVAVNGHNLGRYVKVGPPQTLYLPGAYLRYGENEIIVFEHYQPANAVTFSKDSIFETPEFINDVK